MAGDRPRLRLEVGAGARLFAGTQANTRVYRNPDGLTTGQEMSGEVGEGALCAWWPDPLSPHSEGTWSQVSRWILGRGATLVVLESQTAGRAGFEPAFAHGTVESRLEVADGEGRPLLLESLSTAPDRIDPSLPGAFGDHRISWNLFAVSPDPEACLESLAAAFEEGLAPWKGVREGLAVSSGRSNPATWCARALAADPSELRDLESALRRILSEPRFLGTDPLSRRP